MALDYEVKWRRAFDHIKDFRAKETVWLEENAETVRMETDPKTGKATFFATVAVEPAPNIFGVLIGDCLHNLRSALDALVYGGTPAGDRDDRTAFPIFSDASKFAERIRKQTSPLLGQPTQRSGLFKVRGLSVAAQTAIEGLQPYHAGNPAAHPLWILHELNNIDKHRLVHAVVGVGEGIGLDVGKSLNVAAIAPGVIESFGGPIEGDTKVAIFPGFVPIDPNLQMHVQIRVPVRISFAAQTSSVEFEPVVKTLEAIYTFIGTEVLPVIAPLL